MSATQDPLGSSSVKSDTPEDLAQQLEIRRQEQIRFTRHLEKVGRKQQEQEEHLAYARQQLDEQRETFRRQLAEWDAQRPILEKALQDAGRLQELENSAAQLRQQLAEQAEAHRQQQAEWEAEKGRLLQPQQEATNTAALESQITELESIHGAELERFSQDLEAQRKGNQKLREDLSVLQKENEKLKEAVAEQEEERKLMAEGFERETVQFEQQKRDFEEEIRSLRKKLNEGVVGVPVDVPSGSDDSVRYDAEREPDAEIEAVPKFAKAPSSSDSDDEGFELPPHIASAIPPSTPADPGSDRPSRLSAGLGGTEELEPPPSLTSSVEFALPEVKPTREASEAIDAPDHAAATGPVDLSALHAEVVRLQQQLQADRNAIETELQELEANGPGGGSRESDRTPADLPAYQDAIERVCNQIRQSRPTSARDLPRQGLASVPKRSRSTQPTKEPVKRAITRARGTIHGIRRWLTGRE